MSIVDKLTPHPPAAETGAPSVSLSIEGQRVADVIITALRQKGLAVEASDLIPQAPTAPTALPPKEALTLEEEALLSRAKTFVAAALKDQGISPSDVEIKWMGAAVADFVLAETKAAYQVQAVLVTTESGTGEQAGTTVVPVTTGE